MQTESAAFIKERDDGIESLKRSLRDPYSAHIKIDIVDPSTHVVCGSVNAKNGFGGYAGEDQFIVAENLVTFLSSDPERYDKVRVATCQKTQEREIAWDSAEAKRMIAEAAAINNQR